MSSPMRILVINPNSNKGFTKGLEDLVARLGYSEVSYDSHPNLSLRFHGRKSLIIV